MWSLPIYTLRDIIFIKYYLFIIYYKYNMKPCLYSKGVVGALLGASLVCR